ncbi:ROK family protein [Lactiplantibacillus sp. DA1]|uniref:ROK family protein n=1 Tax=Lactiplantibacillus sp. DA1 TaxID=3079857 RepID=UPI00292A5FEC|nr:ROK family protein [Lactiplantibacillus sp. DA1]MDV0430698.1 ROK family protein [Lactiplantibacillus sp. DA1]
MQQYLVFDIGGTDLKYAIIDRSGKLILKAKQPTQKDSLSQFVQELQVIITQYAGQISGIAISVPGKVHHPDEMIEFGGMLPILNRVRLSDYLDTTVPIVVENDGKAATLAELWQGNLRAVNNGVVLVLGTAVGGGIVLNHHLIRGSHDQAGELSFMKAGQKFTPLEMFGAQGSAVRIIKEISQKLGLPTLTDGVAVFDAIKAGNRVATTIFDHYCYQIATLIQNIQSVIDVERYVVGGGISAQASVVENINRQLDRLRANNSMISSTLQRPEVVTSQFHNLANSYGALYQLIQETELSKNG